LSTPGINDAPGARTRRAAGAGLRRLRLRSAAAAAGAIAFGGLYFFVRQHWKDGIWDFDLYLLNKSLAVASLFLVSLSMVLTAAGYFNKGPGRSLAYRRHYGLAGFWIGLAHGLVSHFLLPEHFPLSSWALGHPAASATGLAALILFGIMAASSNTRVKGWLGGERWRKGLRYAGYLALVIACVHAGVLKWASWTRYFRTFESVLPSLSLPVVLFAAVALALRVIIWRSEARKR
jgi:hypothetical protein